MKYLLLTIRIFIVVVVVLGSCNALAYRLPNYSISDQNRTVPAEDAVRNLKSRLGDLSQRANLFHLAEYLRNPKFRLSLRERKYITQYKDVSVALNFWTKVIALKKDIVSLHPLPQDTLIQSEADAMAKIVIDTIYALSQEYKIVGSALIHNFLINRGVKEKGFCYHYVDALRGALAVRSWEGFDLHWGTAWEGDFRENNALVVTAKGGAFENGIAIDSWRSAGRPFWTKVKGDRFPWVEAFDVEIKTP